MVIHCRKCTFYRFGQLYTYDKFMFYHHICTIKIIIYAYIQNIFILNSSLSIVRIVTLIWFLSVQQCICYAIIVLLKPMYVVYSNNCNVWNNLYDNFLQETYQNYVFFKKRYIFALHPKKIYLYTLIIYICTAIWNANLAHRHCFRVVIVY